MWKPSSWAKDPKDLAEEYNRWDHEQNSAEAVPDKPEEFNQQLVRRGVIDPMTGLATGNSKQRHLSRWTPSRAFLNNFDSIFRKDTEHDKERA